MPSCWSATCSAPGGRSAITPSAGPASSSSSARDWSSTPRGQRSPAALALLSGIACLGTSRQAAAAEQAAITLIDAGVQDPALGRAPRHGHRRQLLREPRRMGRSGRAHLRLQLRRRGAARARLRDRLQRVRHAQGRLGQLAGGQAARPLPASRRPPARGVPARGRLPPDRPAAGAEDARGRARRHRRRGGPAGQRLLRGQARVHQVPYPRAAAVARPRRPGQAARGRPSAGRCSPPSSSPPTRPRSCPTGRPRAAAPT